MHFLQKFGFLPHRLLLGAVYSLGALLAIFLANALGLDHPQWAGMSVWSAAQPMRGAMLEKTAARLGGTVLGVIAGLLLMQITQANILPLCAAVAVWLGFCTWRGNAARSFLSYFWLLAGYSATMVAFLEINTPQSIYALGLDRFLTVAIGVVTAAVFAVLFVPRGPSHPAQKDIAAERARIAPLSDPEALAKRLPALAIIEAGLETSGAGSPRRRAEAASARGEILGISWRLRQRIARRPESRPPAFGAPALNARAAHVDRRMALQAGLRAAGLLFCLGLLWWATGIASGPYLLLGASVMISVFSTFESPHRMMLWVFSGQIVGAAFAVLIRWKLWPSASDEVLQILMLAPMLCAAALAYGHPRTLKMSLDIAMGGLLLMQIGLPLSGTFEGYMGKVAATVGASGIALLTFIFVLRTGPAKRKASARKLILAELALYASGRRALPQDASWHLRHEERALRLAQGQISAPDLALLQFGDEIYEFLKTQSLPERRFKLVAARLGRLHVAPQKAAEALEKWAGRADLAALARDAQII